jgi:hypothetical protein
MEALGLMPSHTHEPGGRRVGQKMGHYLIAGGPFARAAAELLKGGACIAWQSREAEAEEGRRRKAASKTKYTCPACETNAWAKPGVNLICGDCGETMEPE